MEKTSFRIFEEKLSVAPMMEYTNHMLRGFLRLITKHTVLYTEMINCETINRSSLNVDNYLNFPAEQSPVVLQLGGSNVESMALASQKASKYPYSAINLNAGCPSSKVQKGKFGAILMKEPDLVVDLLNAMESNSNLPISVKTRIGLDIFDQQFLDTFVDAIYTKTKCRSIIFHSRIAIMNLDTSKNRTVPPIMYDVAADIKVRYPDLQVGVNGEVKNLDKTCDLLEKYNFDGAMIGRPAYENPWIFAKADSVVFGKKDPGLTKMEALYKYAEFVDGYNCEERFNYEQKVKPLMNIFLGERHCNKFKQMLIDKPKDLEEPFSDKIKSVVDDFYKLNPEAMEKN